MAFVEFYFLPDQDKNARSIRSAMANLNQTINENKFYIDMSGYTGESDRFDAIPYSLGEELSQRDNFCQF